MPRCSSAKVLADLKMQFETLPQETKRQVMAALAEIAKDIERAERKPVAHYDRSTKSCYARA